MTYARYESESHPDPVDAAAALAEAARDIALRRHLGAVEILEDQQIDADGVVHCRDCGDPIPPDRLAALAPRDREGIPMISHSFAVRCIDCQRVAERV